MNTKKHNNILPPDQKGNVNTLGIICRGCAMRKREIIWKGFINSTAADDNNSYLTFEEEPDNKYDTNAIMVVCRGEFFGTVGYVGKEFAPDIKKILDSCSLYRIDMVDRNDAGKKEIPLEISWK